MVSSWLILPAPEKKKIPKEIYRKLDKRKHCFATHVGGTQMQDSTHWNEIINPLLQFKVGSRKSKQPEVSKSEAESKYKQGQNFTRARSISKD